MHTIKPQVYKQKSLTFIVSGDRVIIKTLLDQTFYLQPRAHYWQKRLNLIKVMIELGEVRDLNELASWTNPGITWETTSHEYKLDNLELVR